MSAPGLRTRRMHPVFLDDVSCSSAQSCVLIGARINDTSHPGPGTPLSERWNGRRWQPVTIAPVPAGVHLESLSCTSSTRCIAVGGSSSVGSPSGHAVIERYNGQRWSVSYQAPTRIDGSQLTDVSCPTAGMCVAIGSQHLGSGRLSALVLVLRNGRWQTQTIALSKYPVLAGVSCASASSCLVVGTGGNGGVFTPIARSFDGRSFSPASVPDATRLGGVSCTSSGPCLVTGSIGATIRGRPVADLWNGSSLTPAFSGARGVAACRPTFCMLVGSAHQKAAAYRYSLGPSEASSIPRR
jgi:hypothetical protein